MGTRGAPPPLLHPRMAEIYRGKIADLHAALNEGEATRTEATDILRSLIDAIVLMPQGDELKIELRGDLAGVLTVAANKKSPSAAAGLFSQVEMVAGTCSQRYLHLAKSRIPFVSGSEPKKFCRL